MAEQTKITITGMSQADVNKANQESLQRGTFIDYGSGGGTQTSIKINIPWLTTSQINQANAEVLSAGIQQAIKSGYNLSNPSIIEAQQKLQQLQQAQQQSERTANQNEVQRVLELAKQQNLQLSEQEARYLTDINSREVSATAVKSYVLERNAGTRQQLLSGNPPQAYTPEQETKIAEQIKAGNQVYFTPTGVKISSPVQAQIEQNVPKNIITKAEDIYNTINEDLRKYVSEPLYSRIQKLTGIDLTDIKSQALFTPSIIGIGGFGIKPKPENDILASFSAGINKDVRDNPLKQVALLGAGEVLGFAYKGIATGLSAIPEIGATTEADSLLGASFKNIVKRFAEVSPEASIPIGEIATRGFKMGATGLGIYTGATSIYSDLRTSSNLAEASSVLGRDVKDVLLLGAGFYGGEKTFDIAKGYVRTAGRPYIELPQGEYPQAPVKEQLRLFRENIYKEISDNPVAFHTTADIFYGEGKIVPNMGASELPGLYGSTQVSTPFARIPGSGEIDISTWEKFQQFVENMFAPEKSPGVASLEPKGFRNVEVGFSKTQQFEGQTYVKGRGYAYFKNPIKQGIMDIPGIKTEIEAIARINAGEYEATGKKFYTKIAGVRVPVDSFKYVDEQLNKGLDEMYKNIDESYNKAKFKPEEYSSYENPKISDSIASLSNSINSSISSMESSIAGSTSSKVSSKKSSSSMASSINSNISSLDSSISSSISSMASNISSAVSGLSGSQSGKSSGSSASSGKYPPYTPPYQPPYTPPYNPPKEPPIPAFNIIYPTKKTSKQSLGQGYDVYEKQLKTKNKLVKINHQPLTHKRALDVLNYYLDQSLVRTGLIKKSSGQAQPDYEFIFVPENYYESRGKILRNYRIKNKNPVEFDTERFIKKSHYLLDTEREKQDIQMFKKIAELNKIK